LLTGSKQAADFRTEHDKRFRFNRMLSCAVYSCYTCLMPHATWHMPHATYCVEPIEEEEQEEFYQQTFPTINSASKSPFHMHNHKREK